MKYLIELFKVINPNVGDSTLVYIGENEDDFKLYIRDFERFFKETNTYIKTTFCDNNDRRVAYIEYSFTKEK